MIQIKEGAGIENPREYEPGAVEGLRQLMEVGFPARRDPHRENFYEIESTRPITFTFRRSPETWCCWQNGFASRRTVVSAQDTSSHNPSPAESTPIVAA